jgi:myosin-5
VLRCKMPYDPWENALVWYVTNDCLIWKDGAVKKHVSLQTEWIFTIEASDGTLLDISSKPTDSFHLEFDKIKKRDNDKSRYSQITDMTSLSFLNEPEMIECLKSRYDEKFIYTGIGPILVAVNPFEQLHQSVYSTETIEKYFAADQSTQRKLGPHVFQVSNNAYTKMFIDKFDPDKRENQSILVNGESGSG